MMFRLYLVNTYILTNQCAIYLLFHLVTASKYESARDHPTFQLKFIFDQSYSV